MGIPLDALKLSELAVYAGPLSLCQFVAPRSEIFQVRKRPNERKEETSRERKKIARRFTIETIERIGRRSTALKHHCSCRSAFVLADTDSGSDLESLDLRSIRFFTFFYLIFFVLIFRYDFTSPIFMYLSQRAHDRADVDRLNLEVYVAAPRRDGLLAEVLAVAARLSRFHLAKLRMITVFRVEPTTKASREFFGT